MTISELFHELFKRNFNINTRDRELLAQYDEYIRSIERRLAELERLN